MVSTDSDNYADIAKRHGAHVPFLRSDDKGFSDLYVYNNICA